MEEKRLEFEADTYDGDFSHKTGDADRAETIGQTLAELERIWRENKAQRFCQLLYCLQRGFSLAHGNYGEVKAGESATGYDLFLVEDKYFLDFLKTWKMTKFSAQMEYCSEPQDDDSCASPGDAFFASTPLFKDQSGLPVNLVLGQSDFWKKDGAYFLGVQNDTGKMDCYNLLGMTICDEPQILDTGDEVKLKAEEIAQVKDFVKAHRQDLIGMIEGADDYPESLFGTRENTANAKAPPSDSQG